MTTAGDPEPGTPATPAPRPGAAEIARALVARYVPISRWLPAYPRDWLRPDLGRGR